MLRSCAAWLCVSLVVATAAQAGEWNQWRGPNRDGYEPDSPPLVRELPAEGLTPLWVADASTPTGGGGGGGWSSPVIAGGQVYIYSHVRTKRENVTLPPEKFPQLTDDQKASMTADERDAYEGEHRKERIARQDLEHRWTERLVAFEAATGKVRWENQCESRATRFPQSGTPAVVDGKVLVHGARGRVRAVDVRTGADVWSAQLPGEFSDEHHPSSIAVAGGVAVVAAGRVFGLQVSDGKFLWQADVEPETNSSSSPVIWSHSGAYYAVAHIGHGETACFDLRDGHELWRVKSEAGRSTPVVVGDRLITYGNSRKGGLRCYAMTPDGAEEVWTNSTVADEGCSPVVVEGNVFAHGDRKVACIDLATGKTNWRRELDLERPRYTSLIAADGKVIFAAEALVCFEASPGEFALLIDGRFDREGTVASERHFREQLHIDDLERTPEGQKEAESLWRKQISGGPAQCVSPAIDDGRIYLRLKDNRVACYDLRVRR